MDCYQEEATVRALIIDDFQGNAEHFGQNAPRAGL